MGGEAAGEEVYRVERVHRDQLNVMSYTYPDPVSQSSVRGTAPGDPPKADQISARGSGAEWGVMLLEERNKMKARKKSKSRKKSKPTSVHHSTAPEPMSSTSESCICWPPQTTHSFTSLISREGKPTRESLVV